MPFVEETITTCSSNYWSPKFRDMYAPSEQEFLPPSGINVQDYDYTFRVPNVSDVGPEFTDDQAFPPIIITYLFTFFIGLLGNVVVVIVLLSDKKSRSVTSTILVSLALAHILFLAICVPYEMWWKQLISWTGGVWLCKIATFVETLCATSSVLNLTAAGIERYVVIVHPMKSRSWCSVGKSRKLAAIVWTISIVTSSPVLYVTNLEIGLVYDSQAHVIVRTCTDRNIANYLGRVFVWYQLLTIFIFPLLIMTCCYSFVVVKLWFSTKQLVLLTNASQRSRTAQYRSKPSSSSRASSSTSNSADMTLVRRQVIRILITIVLMFFACWGPKWIIHVMKRLSPSALHSSKAFFVLVAANLLPYIHCCINPLIYSCMSSNFRQSCRDTFHRFPSCSNGSLHGTISRTGLEQLPMSTIAVRCHQAKMA